MSETSNLRPVIRYKFRSVTGKDVTITSRLGEGPARRAAMKHLWGDSCPAIPSERGEGLDLLATEEVS